MEDDGQAGVPASRSGRLRRGAQRSGEVLKRVRDSEPVQAARETTGNALRRGGETARATRPGQALSRRQGRPAVGGEDGRPGGGHHVQKGRGANGFVAGSSRAIHSGRQALWGRDGRPAAGMWAWILLGVATVGATFLSWLSIDVVQPVSGVAAYVPTSLLEALDRGYSVQEVAGLGLALTAVTVASLACGGLGFVLRRWYLWLCAAIIQILGLGLAAIGLAAAVGARAAKSWLVPAEWEPYAPHVTVGAGSMAYLALGSGFVLASIAIAVTSRRRRRPRVVVAAADPYGSG